MPNHHKKNPPFFTHIALDYFISISNTKNSVFVDRKIVLMITFAIIMLKSYNITVFMTLLFLIIYKFEFNNKNTVTRTY
jgi:hypothetical protein